RRRVRRFAVLLVMVVLLALSVVALHTLHTLQPRTGAHVQGAGLQTAPPQRQTAWLHAGSAWAPLQAQQLRAELLQHANDVAFPAATGILVIDGRDGRTLYSHNAHLPLIPGSVVKLVTAAAALGVLGPNDRFTTSIVTDGSREGGLLNGSLWLVGGGDPELTSDNLRAGVREVQLGGIQSVSGNIYADGSRYGPDQVASSWQADDLQYGWAAPASALSIDGGSVQFTITPRAGLEADVAVDPPGHRVIASVETAGADAENTLRIDLLPNNSGYEVRGQIPFGAPQKYWRAVPHPTGAAAVSLLAMLRLAGITVAGTAAEKTAPAPNSLLWQHKSRTVDLIIKHMLLLSDNHYGEELLRAVGWKASGLGDLTSSLEAERTFMRNNAIPARGVVMVDGSGLSGQNRLTAQSIAATLRFLLQQPLPAAPFALLPRAGIEGTVAVRHLAPETKGRVFAKDGYIEGASALAGYVLSAHHGPVIFVFLVNEWEHGLDAVWTHENQMLDLIARQ
ncbi:MAG: D-alanyl-D-alanine carboxypeptidase/D-alanyl-D-alanine-endopeptidase, partial [Candidatus Eremiobacteraeota bacterium]|nr:D-alanyl-D-alanine carboxypeptidase/D-alanyl-D-alanine-endopeptidase [Candidatus Eremiobacteraeota bacterium]